ncbi:MAG: hypothetical protein U0T68_12395 [Ferruginibacter sp.]
MSYDVRVYTKETMENEKNFSGEDFFEIEENIISFTPDQYEKLKQMIDYDLVEIKRDDMGVHYQHKNESIPISGLLTSNALYLSTPWNPDGIFEIGMLASELTVGEFAKYDPQNNGWEYE